MPYINREVVPMEEKREKNCAVDDCKRKFLKTTLSISAASVLINILSPFIPASEDNAEAGPCCYSNCHGARGRR